MSQIWAPLAEGQRPGIYVPGQFIYLQGTQADAFFYLSAGRPAALSVRSPAANGS